MVEKIWEVVCCVSSQNLEVIVVGFSAFFNTRHNQPG